MERLTGKKPEIKAIVSHIPKRKRKVAWHFAWPFKNATSWPEFRPEVPFRGFRAGVPSSEKQPALQECQ
jgi:hypothetical protein